MSGGSIGDAIGEVLEGLDGSVLNISGGKVNELATNAGTHVNISGGYIGLFSEFQAGTVDVVSGGRIAPGLYIHSGSDVSLVGGEFSLNGGAPPGSTVTLGTTDILTGTYQDGTPFIFVPDAAGRFEGVKLVSAALPAIDTTPMTISTDSNLNGLRPGQSATLVSGGVLHDALNSVGASLNVTGGTVGNYFQIAGTQLTMSSGTMGQEPAILAGSTATISGGTFGKFFHVGSNATANISGGTFDESFTAGGSQVHSSNVQVNVSGGTFGSRFGAFDGSAVNITGGSFGAQFYAGAGSHMNISGPFVSAATFGDFEAGSGSNVTISSGLFSPTFVADVGSNVAISGGSFATGFSAPTGANVGVSGGEFRLNGAPFAGSTVNLGATDVLSGTLADGSPFIFTPQMGDDLGGVTFTPVALPAIDTTPIVVTNASVADGLRQGQSLTLQSGGSLNRNFQTVGATLQIDGGTMGNGFEASESQVNIAGGQIGQFGSVYKSTVNISGGSIGTHFLAGNGSTVNIIRFLTKSSALPAQALAHSQFAQYT